MPRENNKTSKCQDNYVSRVKEINLGENEKENNKYKIIYKLIERKVAKIDEIYTKTEISINEINNILFLLEINGFIKKVAGGYTCILDKE